MNRHQRRAFWKSNERLMPNKDWDDLDRDTQVIFSSLLRSLAYADDVNVEHFPPGPRGDRMVYESLSRLINGGHINVVLDVSRDDVWYAGIEVLSNGKVIGRGDIHSLHFTANNIPA